MAPAGPWELAFLLGRWDLFFRASARKFFFGVFLVIFCVFVVFWGCFCAFLVFFFCYSRAARIFFLIFFFRGDFFFSRGREQNVKFPLWLAASIGPATTVDHHFRRA